MYGIVETDYDNNGCGCCSDMYIVGIIVYNGIDTGEQYREILKEFTNMKKEASKLRKTRKIQLKDEHVILPKLMEELGYPTSFNAYLESKGITFQKIEFETE